MTALPQLGKQVGERGAEFGLGLGRLEWRDIFADRDDDQVGLEIELGLQPGGDVVGGMLPLEVGDVSDHRHRLPMRRGGEPSEKEMDVVFIRRAGGHSPVPLPSDIFRRCMQGDAVPQEQHFSNAKLVDAKVIGACALLQSRQADQKTDAYGHHKPNAHAAPIARRCGRKSDFDLEHVCFALR